MSYPGEHAVLRGIVVNRSGANNNRLADVTIEGDGSQNTIQVYGADFTLQGSDITNAWRGRSCLMLGDPSAGTAVRPVIRGNRFHECGSKSNGNLDHGIYANIVDRGLITENIFWNSAGYAIQLYPSAQNTVFSHNVVDGGGSTARGGVILGGESSSPSSGNTIEYNVIAYAINYNLESYWGGAAGSNNIARSNCLYGAGEEDVDATRGGLSLSGNVVRDPLFVDRSAHDLRLGKSSECRDIVRYDVLERALASRASK
jgi:Right handed beta helix region